MDTRPRLSRYLLLALALVLLAPGIPGAQQPGAGRAVPAAAPLDTAALKVEKLQEEVRKLRNEARGLEDTNEALGRTTRWLTAWMAALGGILGVLATLVIAVAGFRINRTQRELGEERHALESRKIEQERLLGREKHMLEVFNALGSEEPRIRIGAVAVLVQRLQRIRELQADPRVTGVVEEERAEQMSELPTIVSVLISVTKHEQKEEIQKYIADGLANSLGAIVPAGESPTAEKSPLARYDFQGAKLQNAWWKGIDARGVDFYEACLARAGLRNALLQGAVLKGADLSGATLSGARLDGADLQNSRLAGAKLAGAKLVGARLMGADLTDADLSGADLTGADLTGALLAGVKLDRAVLRGVRPDPATLPDVDPTHAVLDDPSPAAES